MAGERTLRHPSRAPSHPGEFLDEIVVPGTGKSSTELAALLGVSRQTFDDLLAGRQAVTPAMALRLGKLFGNGPDLWLNLQRAHDLWHAEREMKDALAAIEPLAAA